MMARLFFALWPDEAARIALAARAEEIARLAGGCKVPAANLHLTLVFLGEVDATARARLERVAAGVAADAFTIELDTIGGFRRAQVAWAGCRKSPPELLALQAALERGVREAGFRPDERPYAPHLTLARRVRDAVAARAMEPASWRATSFALVESGRGDSAYRTVADWPLRERES